MVKKQERIRVTFYLYPEDIIAIDLLQIEEFRKKGKKPQKSEIVSRAIRLLKEKSG